MEKNQDNWKKCNEMKCVKNKKFQKHLKQKRERDGQRILQECSNNKKNKKYLI